MAAHIVDKGSLVYDPEDYETFKQQQTENVPVELPQITEDRRGDSRIAPSGSVGSVWPSRTGAPSSLTYTDIQQT